MQLGQAMWSERAHDDTRDKGTLALKSKSMYVRYSRAEWGVIDPRSNTFMPYWDIVMVVLLFFTATVTPYEVCFFDEPDLHNEGPDAMWIVNRCIDTLFMIDIILTMNTMFERQTLEGPIWIGSRRLIIQNYLCASPWCVVDVVSVFPFYLLNYAMAAAADNGNSTTLTTTTSAESFSSLRMVKLLRMLKLARMFKAAAYFAPVVKDVIMVRLEMTYAALKVLELIMWLLLFTQCAPADCRLIAG